MVEMHSGVALQGVDPPMTFAAMVAEIEDLSFDHLWITDSSLHARNCYVELAVAATHSSRLTLGTAVTNPLTRHPAITAAAAATLDELSGGRMVLGVGAGDRPLLALGMRPSRLGDLESMIGALRRLWAGEHVSLKASGFALEDAFLRFPARPDIPIFLATSGPRTLELAGRVADGVIGLVGLFPEAVTWALDHVRRGAVAAGRPMPHFAVFAYGAIDADREAALDRARSIAAWFPQTQPGICELAGLPASVVEEVRASYGGGEFQEASRAASLLPDSFVRKVALAGNEDDATVQILRVLEAGADSVHVFPLGATRMETVRAFARCVRRAAVRGGK